MSEASPENRRPLKSRGSGWAQTSARLLAKAGASPNAISAASVVFAALGFSAFWVASNAVGPERAAALIGAAACIQLRLVCNLLDGMVAVEYRRGSTSGPIWNELPDRIADALFLVGAGLCAANLGGLASGVTLGWLAAALAILTAYVRELGRGLGFAADFSGPMAKPHRMAALTATSAIAAAEPLWRGHGEVIAVGLAVIVVGTIATVIRRTLTLARRLAQAKA